AGERLDLHRVAGGLDVDVAQHAAERARFAGPVARVAGLRADDLLGAVGVPGEDRGPVVVAVGRGVRGDDDPVVVRRGRRGVAEGTVRRAAKLGRCLTVPPGGARLELDGVVDAVAGGKHAGAAVGEV